MDRRSFFKTTTAAGSTLFLPDWITRAENLAKERRLLPTEVRRPGHVLYASPSESSYGQYVLCLDSKQYSEPPPITLREYLEEFQYLSDDEFEDAEFLMDEHCMGIEDLDEPLGCDNEGYYMHYVETWCLNGSPESAAYHYIDGILDRLRHGRKKEELGGILLLDCPSICSTYRAAEVEDTLSLSCLQRALVALGEDTLIQIDG
jgi:hypothetical protein